MKQHIETVHDSSSVQFEREVNRLIGEGYRVQSTCISKREVGTYDEYSVYDAILLKETDE